VANIGRIVHGAGLQAACSRDGRVVHQTVIGLVIGVAGDHHLQSDHAEGTVVEHDNGQWQLVGMCGDEFTHQHK
jgi:hypothetical protein